MYLFSSIICLGFALSACVMKKEKEPPEINERMISNPQIDLMEILKDGKLTVLVENSTTTYFYYKGRQMGFEYEILKLFAEDLGVELDIKVVNNLDSLISFLNSGKGDIIACNFTVTRERSKVIDFSESFLQTQQVLVQQKPDGWEEMKEQDWKAMMINSPDELIGKKIHVWKNSSYYERLIHLQEEIGDSINIQGMQGDIGGEELIEMVAEGLIDYTISESNVAELNKQFFDNLYTDVDISVKQKMSFGLRKTSPLLKHKLDEWLIEFMSHPTFRYISKKYFEKKHVTNHPGIKYAYLNSSSISRFDQEFKKAEEYCGWDWRLIASISYQESKFNPNALSFGGAYGMMQFMPNTGPTYGVYPNSTPEAQILGAAKKLKADEKYWKDIPNEYQRKKFALASYNAGRGHILDAQRLANKYDLDPLIWDDNVEAMLLKLSKKEFYQDEVVRHGMMKTKITFNYVRQVTERYFDWVTIYD